MGISGVDLCYLVLKYTVNYSTGFAKLVMLYHKEAVIMEIRMYECGFGDCFRLREKNQTDLYVDFGIHKFSWSGINKTNRFDNIIADMEDDKDFLLTHYHSDHFNGAIYMAKNTTHRFKNVYIPDVWNMSGSIYVISLLLLRGIFTRSVINERTTIIDFLQSICTKCSRIHFISRGDKIQNGRYVALWPEKRYMVNKAQRIFEKLQDKLRRDNLASIERIANQLNILVVELAGERESFGDAYMVRFNELRENYIAVQKRFDELYKDDFDNNIQYKLTRFGNEISIVFQNAQADRNVLFTGDFGKKNNWTFIENNQDSMISMHPYYDVVKVPHHGTPSYYHSFIGKICPVSTLLIPNGYVRTKWFVDSKYKTDSSSVNSKMVCAHNMACSGRSCPRCCSIFPGVYLDV